MPNNRINIMRRGLLLTAAGCVALSACGSQGSNGQVSASKPGRGVTEHQTASKSVTLSKDDPVPAGYTGVLDHSGALRGYVKSSELDNVGFPTVNLGSGRYDVHGLAVRDAEGTVIGYTLEGLGFVDVETVENASAFDAAYAAFLKRAEERAAADEARKQEVIDHARENTSPG